MRFRCWHDLLNSRYVCQACTTRFFVRYSTCPACRQHGTVHPLQAFLRDCARNDNEYRLLIVMGQDPTQLTAVAQGLDYQGPGV